MCKKLAKIKKATLEIQERGILNFWIYVNYEDGFSQNIGGIALDTWDDSKGDRVGTAYGCEMIRRLLIELNVDDFSEMKGKYIWVLGEGTTLDFEPKGVQALKVDSRNANGVIFSKVFDEFKEASV